ncbi:MAG: hypothetical protein A2V77_16975 [Anaeromyxobacter sp. RBG_16_69_14]|nr:MAG: hypothetical protein A2V77_16975 [Anaeromyxobacter sp. RBG_16_69_14]
MKRFVHAFSAIALIAVATPALPCDSMKSKTTAEKADSAAKKQAVAKSDATKADPKAKAAPKAPTAAN